RRRRHRRKDHRGVLDLGQGVEPEQPPELEGPMIDSALRSERLRNALTLGGVAAPGAFNALAARAIERRGFSAAYLSGAAVSNCVVGVPDACIITLDDVVGHAERIAKATSLPLIADIDTGFGGPMETAET